MLMTVFRDTGPYSARNSSKGALIAEAGRVIERLRSGLSLDELRARALDGDLFPQRARATRKRIWVLLHYRYLSQPDWVLSALQSAYGEGAHSQEFVSFLYLHYALRDHLTYDFVTEILWDRWGNQQRSVVREDVLSLLDQAAGAQPQIQRWTESTHLRLAGSILTALRDFGVLEGKQKKTLVRPMLPLSAAEHLLRILTAEGLRGSQVLRDSSWRLFFREENDVAHILSLLAQERRIHFERVGSTVVLDTPQEWKRME
jgi:hypothetical protein